MYCYSSTKYTVSASKELQKAFKPVLDALALLDVW